VTDVYPIKSTDGYHRVFYRCKFVNMIVNPHDMRKNTKLIF
jgi:hypothetical protein